MALSPLWQCVSSKKNTREWLCLQSLFFLPNHNLESWYFVDRCIFRFSLHSKRRRALWSEREWKCDDLPLWQLVCHKVVSHIRKWGVWWSDHIRSQRVLAFCMQFEEVWVASMFWWKRQVEALTFYIFFSLLENTTQLRKSMKCSYNIVWL